MKKQLLKKLGVMTLFLAIMFISTRPQFTYAKSISNNNNSVITVNNLSTDPKIGEDQVSSILNNSSVSLNRNDEANCYTAQ